MNLRPYQEEAIEAVLAEFQRVNSTLIVCATGTGKTLIFSQVAGRCKSLYGRTLVLAHREELLTQAQEKIEQWTSLSTGIEQGENSISPLFMPDVVIASVQTLSRPNRMERFDRKAFGLIITDEAHHSTSPTYGAIYRYFQGYKHLGVTATPDRLDGKGMGAVFETSAFVYEIRDAIEGGYLVPIRQKSIEVESLDISKVRTTAGDLNEGDLEAVMMEERNLHEVAAPTVREAGERSTLIFATTVEHAKALAAVIGNYAPDKAAHIDGTFNTIDREKTLTNFRNGKIQFLSNVGILTEGVDIPQIACVSMARPTKSRALYCQAIGRGTRLYPGKDSLLALDFVGNSGKHSLVCAMDVLDGNTDLEVKARAQTLCKKKPELNILEALEEAAKELAEEKRVKVIAEARYHTVEIDPFTIIGVRPRAGRWGGAPMTPKQQAMLERAKIPWQHLDKGQAVEIIDKIIQRSQQKLCTVPMAKLLMKYGLNPDVPFEVAKRQIDAIAGWGWRLNLRQHEFVQQIAV